MRTGVLMISDNADLDAPQPVKLQGRGIEGRLRYSPFALLFAKQGVNTTSAPKTIKILNPNLVPMEFSASATGDYAIASNT
jgi:hypothetical protein